MWFLFFTIAYLLRQECLGIYLVDIPQEEVDQFGNVQLQYKKEPHKEVKVQIESPEAIIKRRLMNPPYPPVKYGHHFKFRQDADSPMIEDEKDKDIKLKIKTLVQQAVHDTERKIKSIEALKNKHREKAPYKIGFILSMIKKARDVLNELFNVSVKHRDEWKALEQLKIFELIVHTNVDTTNLVRQLVEIHIQHLNSTSGGAGRRRVLLL